MPSGSQKNLRILIVDDDPDLLEVMTTKLQTAGFSVFTAEDGVGGIEKAKSVHPDLILLDVQMPEMDGITTLLELKKDPRLASMRVVFLTNLGETYANATDVDTAIAKEIGALGYIRKSDDLDKIIQQVRDLVIKA